VATQAQWRRTLRRAYRIPDFVSDELAFDAILERLVEDYWSGGGMILNGRPLFRGLVDTTIEFAAAGELDEAMLPDDLPKLLRKQRSVSWTPAEYRILQELAKHESAPSPHMGGIPTDCRTALDSIIGVLRSYLTDYKLAYTSADDKEP
jgi:hypothetical protein